MRFIAPGSAENMTNRETAEHIRRYFAKYPNGMGFSWCTDGCGYEQHMRFVRHRNEHWTDERAERQTFREFALEYADMLEREE